MAKRQFHFAAMILASAVAAATPAAAQDAIRIGTSSAGTAYYAVTVGAAEIINKFGALNTTVEPVGGSAANVIGVASKKVEMALVNALAAVDGRNGASDFKGKKYDTRLVLQGQPAFRSLLVRKGISKPADLIDKTIVGKRRALPDLEMLSNAYIKVFKLPADRVKVVATTNTGEAEDALRAGSVAGSFLPFSPGSPQVQRPMQDGIADFLYLDQAQATAVLKELPDAFFLATFKKDTFANQAKDQVVFGMNSYFIAQPELKDETVYRAMKAIVEHIPEFTTYHKQGGEWALENTLRDFGIPFHPGAVRYLKERNVWTAEMESRQKQLLARN